MVVIVTCKNEGFLSKNEGPGVVTTVLQLEVYRNFFRPSRAAKSAAPGLILQNCRISNPSKILWLSSSPARMKKIQSKMKALEWSQHFSHYKSMGIFSDTQGQLTPSPWSDLAGLSNPCQILWLSLLPAANQK